MGRLPKPFKILGQFTIFWRAQRERLPRAAIIWSLSKNVFEQRTATVSGLVAFLGRGFAEIFGQIVSLRVKTLKVARLDFFGGDTSQD